MNKKYSKMKTYKEILIILIGSILMFGGLSLILTAEILNAIILVGVIMICSGIGCFAYLFRSYYIEEK